MEPVKEHPVKAWSMEGPVILGASGEWKQRPWEYTKLYYVDHLVYSGEAHKKDLNVFDMFKELMTMVPIKRAMSQEEMLERFVNWTDVFENYMGNPQFSTHFLSGLRSSIDLMLKSGLEIPEREKWRLAAYKKLVQTRLAHMLIENVEPTLRRTKRFRM